MTVANVYYGWKIVITLFITLTFCSGLGFYNHAVTLQALVSEKGLSVEIASTAVSLFFLSSGVVGLWIAGLLERYDVRAVVIGGACLASAALLSIRFVVAEWQVLVAYSVFGVGFAASGLLSATTLITRWFAAKRALALSITSTGLSVGGIVITPASALLLEARGLDYSVTVFAIVYLLGVVPLSLAFLKSRPSDLGMQIDGALLDKDAPITPTGILFKDAIRGAILDRISATKFALFMMVLQSAALLSLSQVSSVWAFVVGLGLFGISVGNLLMLQPLLLAATYGQQHYSRIYGLSNMMTTIGIASGPLMLGIIYSASGTYSMSFLIASLAGLIGFAIYGLALRTRPSV